MRTGVGNPVTELRRSLVVGTIAVHQPRAGAVQDEVRGVRVAVAQAVAVEGGRAVAVALLFIPRIARRVLFPAAVSPAVELECGAFGGLA